MTRAARYVWRVQDEHGCGPYNASCGRRNVAREIPFYRDNVCIAPSPYADGLPEHLWGSGEYVFAFPSLHALFDWFDVSALRTLRRAGYVPRKLAAREVRVSESGRQCVAKLL